MKPALWIVPLFALTLIGCGKEQPQGQAARTTVEKQAAVIPAPQALAELNKVAKPERPFKIALIVKTRNNPFFTPMIASFETEAKEMGLNAEVELPPQETDKEKQFALVQTEIGKGVDAILIAPADSKGIVPALKAAQDKGVIVINLDNRVDPETASAQGLDLNGYIGTDNEDGGKLAGEAMLSAGGKGKVLMIEGIPGVDNAEARKKGFTEAVQGKLEIVGSQTANWDTATAYSVVQNLLAAHPDVNGIFCANDKMALGAIQAISEARKKGKIKVVGFDGIPEAIAKLKTGELTATIAQRPDLMGKYGVRMAVGIIDKSFPSGHQVMIPLTTLK